MVYGQSGSQRTAMNNKFSIGVVIAIVLQVSAFVWWTAQQAQTISQLNQQVAELTSRMAVEDDVNMKRDIKELKSALAKLDEKLNVVYAYVDDETSEIWEDLDYDAEIEGLRQLIENKISDLDKKLSD
jgi:signal transduction histidine kinase